MPRLSVIIVATWSADVAIETASRIDPTKAQILIACSHEITPCLSTQYIWIQGKIGEGVPELRGKAIEQAEGDVIAFLEDACLPDLGWTEAVIQGFDDPQTDLVGGPVKQSTDSTKIDWAVYFAEYAPFAVPQNRVAGLNFACRKSILKIGQPIYEHAFSDMPSWLTSMSVKHMRKYDWDDALRDRRRFGLEYGELRWRGRVSILTSLGVIATPGIFAIQICRLVNTTRRCRSLLLPLIQAFVPTIRLLWEWSISEARGWRRAWQDRQIQR
jgi:hypothetical protein